MLDGASGADEFHGDIGRDRAEYSTRTAALSIDLDGVADDGFAGEADNVAPTVEDVTGGSGADVLTGSFAVNHLVGGTGNDRLNGLGSDDVLTGGAGGDLLLGGSGADSLQGVDGVFGNDELNGQTHIDACASDTDDEEFACESRRARRRLPPSCARAQTLTARKKQRGEATGQLAGDVLLS